MNIIKIAPVVVIAYFVSFLILNSLLGIPTTYDNLSIIMVLSIAAPIVIIPWACVVFSLIDSESRWDKLLAVIVSGIGGLVLLLGLRWGYQKSGLTILD
jgi:hypothetical protein